MTLRALVLATACLVVPLPAAAQTAKPAAKASIWNVQRNVWGHPDLSGVWTNATITRLERDPRFGDQLVLSAEDARRLEGANAKVRDAAALPTDQKTGVDDLPTCGDGSSGPACGYNAFWVAPGTKVIRIGGEARSSILVAPKNGRLPLNDAAVARQRAAFGNGRLGNFDGPERRPLGERCLVGFGSTSGPPMLPVLYNNHYQIAQTGTEVMIQVEMVHDTRIIRLGGQHPPASVRLWMGDSIGRWEGDTLVVETTNFRRDQTFRGATENMKVVEYFTRISPQQIKYAFEVIDPATFTEPVKGEQALNVSDEAVYEYACHEGNYALHGILAGAREEERQGREMEGNRGAVKEEGGE